MEISIKSQTETVGNPLGFKWDPSFDTLYQMRRSMEMDCQKVIGEFYSRVIVIEADGVGVGVGVQVLDFLVH
jgi:hypothetical protein